MNKSFEEGILEAGGVVVMLTCSMSFDSNFIVKVYQAKESKLWNSIHEFHLRDSRTYYRHQHRYNAAVEKRYLAS